MVKKFISKSLIGLFLFLLSSGITLAADEETPATSDNPVQAAGMQSRCQNLPEGFPECADSPSECFSVGEVVQNTSDVEGGSEYSVAGSLVKYYTPINCLFLGEPIGGRTGYDLYKIVPEVNGQSSYQLWYGEALVPNEYGKVTGPFQALLTYEEGKQLQGPFGLLYNYLGLIYNYLSGIIIAVVILIVIVAGIIITTSNGNQESFNTGKSMITKALVGMVIWFLASVILYTINPTFFSF